MHWSYTEILDHDLAQGDILLPTNDLRKALDTAHKWFNDPKYLGFVVISQTCDLVRRRGGPCKTPYIEIAVVRPFRAHILALLRQHCCWIGDRIFPKSEWRPAAELVDRIINQNESSLGIFYLHPEAAIGIGEGAIALLRVSISLRASEHYETLVAARKGRLHPEFANKMGWLCGNLYSRVGIRDWKESKEDKRTAESIKKDLLGGENGSGPLFLECPSKFLDDVREGKISLQAETAEKIESVIREYTEKPYKDRALGAIGRVLERQSIDEATRTKVRNILNSDPDFVNSLRPGAP